MPKESKIRDKLVKYINENPSIDGYVPSFFVNMFTTDVHYCRHLLLELANKGKVIKRTYKGKNHKQAYRFFSNGQMNDYGVTGMNNFISPSVFYNNNIETSIETAVSLNPTQWKKFVKKKQIHYLELEPRIQGSKKS